MNNIEIRSLRKEMGLTQEQLAKIIGVSTKTIVNYEKGSVIPNSKKELLHNVLVRKKTFSEDNFENEPYVLRGLKNEKLSQSVNELIEELNERKKIVELLYKNKANFKHQLLMLGLVESRLKLELGYYDLSTENIDTYPYYTFFDINDYSNNNE